MHIRRYLYVYVSTKQKKAEVCYDVAPYNIVKTAVRGRSFVWYSIPTLHSYYFIVYGSSLSKYSCTDIHYYFIRSCFL